MSCTYITVTCTCTITHACIFSVVHVVHVFSILQEYLGNITKDPKKSTFCKQRSLCHSIAGNTVHLLTITSPAGSPNEAQVTNHPSIKYTVKSANVSQYIYYNINSSMFSLYRTNVLLLSVLEYTLVKQMVHG